ncbi:MAG: hypothetical protein H3C31_02555 [Brumimicrobium sp.]|nr:hypothetical protein [Brumimicrobium sp.]MCO5269795.1 hypothetical protein [Brumimicrobium sp.]
MKKVITICMLAACYSVSFSQEKPENAFMSKTTNVQEVKKSNNPAPENATMEQGTQSEQKNTSIKNEPQGALKENNQAEPVKEK